ncbi:oxidative DNA demethylase [Podochytrium sp. JEL0797]|nr:oxidative DNA demethylase [Podochytrium sp. JEL0797]
MFADVRPAIPTAAAKKSPDESLMSRKDFRYSVFETLKENGISDKLKSQLRSNIILELKKRSLFTPTTSEPIEPGVSLIHKAIDSLIVDYLKRKHCDFTLSVFLPECGLAGQVLCERDVLRVLHVDSGEGSSELVRSFRKQVNAFPKEVATIVKLLESVSQVLDISSHEKECQTDMDEAETMDSELRRITNHLLPSSKHALSHSLHTRLQEYQDQLTTRLQNDTSAQLASFKDLELARMRLEERARYTAEVNHLKGEYEMRLLEQRGKMTTEEETQRRWIETREKELEKNNLDLRQQLLEESHRAVMVESAVRAEAEIRCKKFEMENGVLVKRLEDSQALIGELEGFKERYATKTQEALAEFKIELNKEHVEFVSGVQVEKAKIESEKAILAERAKVVARQLEQIQDSQAEMQALKDQLKSVKQNLRSVEQERDDALFLTRDLKLQVDSQTSGAALEFEMLSLKTQLLEAERTGARRQEEYQDLIKSFMAPQNDLQKEVTKLRKSESRWQRECQDLVVKLDLELNRNETLQQKFEEEVLRNKQLKRDVAELKLLVHRIQSTSERGNGEGFKSFSRMSDMIPNPLHILSTPASPNYRTPRRYTSSPTLPKHQPGHEDSPPRGMTLPAAPSPDLTQAWDHGTRRMEALAYRAAKGSLGYYENGEWRWEGEAGLPLVSVDVRSFAEDVLGSFTSSEGLGGGRGEMEGQYVGSRVGAGAALEGRGKVPSAAPFALQKPVPVSPALHQPSNARKQTPEAHQHSTKATETPIPARKSHEPTVDEIRKSLQESIQSLNAPATTPPPKSSSPPLEPTRAASPPEQTNAAPKPSLQSLLKQEQEAEEQAHREQQRLHQQAEYERRRAERERRDRELEELERKTVDEEAAREKEKARLAGRLAREVEERKMSLSSGSLRSLKKQSESLDESLSGVSGKGEDESDAQLGILNELEADPVMQKYMQIVKEKREMEQATSSSAKLQDEKVNKILSALENTSLISSDESGTQSKVFSGETMDEISAPSTTEDVLDDPW